MTCELEFLECIVIADAGNKLSNHIDDIIEEVKKFTTKYGEKDILVQSSKGRLDRARFAHTRLIELGNKCNCNIDVKTSAIK